MTGEVYYAWVRVGDGDPEPAAIEGEKPNRKATTFGCPDTFDVDDPESGCVIVMGIRRDHHDADLDRPHEMRIDDWAEVLEMRRHTGWSEISLTDAALQEERYQKAIKRKPHRYAGFGRKGR